jgi:hypothetical protein
MKYTVHNTQEEAEAENQRLMGLLGIPDNKGTVNYGVPEERDGNWIFRIKDQGSWKADHLANNLQELPLPALPDHT